KFALVLLTDRRVLIVRGGLTMGAEDLPLEQITAVSTSLTKLTIATGGRQEVDVRAVSKPEEIASAIRQAISQAGVAGSDSHASAQPDVYDQLRKLGELRDAGVLTTEEFEEKKANLLGQI
ncbi:MAG TPA: SHOCT domain-containing protein, partial [Thermoleophilaceae bacterium]